MLTHLLCWISMNGNAAKGYFEPSPSVGAVRVSSDLEGVWCAQTAQYTARQIDGTSMKNPSIALRGRSGDTRTAPGGWARRDL